MSVETANRARIAEELLSSTYPDARPSLLYNSPLELLIAVILSAQTTDEQVNRVTPHLFARFPDAEALARAAPLEVEKLIHPLGFFRQKSRSIIATAEMIAREHKGSIPDNLPALLKLRGVGRKSANIVLSVVYGQNAGIAVDTHVGRIARRLGLTSERDPDRVERDLESLLPQYVWARINLVWVLHGRQTCRARKPLCAQCVLYDICPRIGVER